MITTAKPTTPIEIFYSYSHKDEHLRDQLEDHLSALQRQGVITGWHDRKIGAGTEWQSQIDEHLKSARIILLLISANFLASPYCNDVEIQLAMQRHEAGEARVIPIILRAVDWEEMPFAKLQALPKDAKPIAEWRSRDRAFLNVAKGIRAAIEELTASGTSTAALHLESTYPPEVPEFVGRKTELAYFAEKLKQVHLAVIAGAPGVGKSVLAAKLARSVSEADKIFWHSFHKDEGAESVASKAAEFLARNGQPALWQMIQRAQQLRGQKLSADDLFSYLIQLVRGQGYVFCLDDFQFVEQDPQLAALIDKLRAEVSAGNLSLIITSRHMPGFVSTADFEALEGLTRVDARNLLTLRGLSLSDKLVSDLHNATCGNAQFLILAIAALRNSKEHESLIAQLSQTEDIGQYLLTQVYEGFTEDERNAMRAIATLLGYSGTRDAIEAILDKSGLQPILDSLHYRFLLSTNNGDVGREFGQHAMVQAYYYVSCPTTSYTVKSDDIVHIVD